MNIHYMLKLMRKAVRNKTYDMIPTAKNRNSRRKYGLTMLDVEDIIMSLEEKDLVKGPVKDYDYPNEEVFISKKKLENGAIFYIKLKYKNGIIKILSFHEDE